MSEDEDKFDLYASMRFIQELGANTCPMCQNETWVVETNSDTDIFSGKPQTPTTFTLKRNDAFMSPSSVVPTIAFTCRKCGFFRQHNLAWLKDLMSVKG